MSKTSTMPVPKHATPVHHKQPPAFIQNIMQAVRTACEKDSVIRIRTDNSAKSVVAFTATWLGTGQMYGTAIRDINRRVYVETKLDKDNNYVVVFMAKLFDENAVTITYAQDQFNDIATDVLRYLRMGTLPESA